MDFPAEDTPLSQRCAETQNRQGKRLKLYAGHSPASGSRSRNSHFIEGPISDSSEESCDGMDSAVKSTRPTRSRRKWPRDIEEHAGKTDEIETRAKKIRSTRNQLLKHEENSYDGTELDVKRVRLSKNRRQWHNNSEDQIEKHDENSCDGIDVDVKKTRSSRNQWPQDADEQVAKHDEHSLDGADGVRRSTRKKKEMNGTMSASWLFGNQSIKVQY